MPLWFALVLGAATVGPLDRALALENSGDDSGALTAALEATRAAPNWGLAHLEAGRLALKLGKSDVARFELYAAQALLPENPRVQFLFGELFDEQGQGWKAAAAMERAVSLRSDYLDAHRALAGMYLSLKDPFRAELHVRAALSLGGDPTLLTLQLAEAMEGQGRAADAETLLRRLHASVPANRIVLTRLADLLRREGKASEADKLEKPLAAPARVLRPLRPSRR